MKKTRATAFVLLFTMILNLMPIQVFAEAAQNERQNEELLREELKTAVDETEYPNGLFDFLTTRMNTSEDLSSVEFAIVRKGGTAGKASITLKAIDVSAKYGEDYTISIPKGIFSETLPENKEARPLMEGIANSENENEQDTNAAEEPDIAEGQEETAEKTEADASDQPAEEQTDEAAEVNSESREVEQNTTASEVVSPVESEEPDDTVTEEANSAENEEEQAVDITQENNSNEPAEEQTDAAQGETSPTESEEDENTTASEESNLAESGEENDTVAEEVYSESESQIEYEQLPAPVPENSKRTIKKVSLREARDAFVGKKSDELDWREADLQEKESAKEAYNDMYENTPGVSCILDFEDGEYMKKIRFNIINDKISEDDEQVLLVLLDPEGAELGEANNAYMNIEDNEEKEKIAFEIAEKEISVNRNSDFAEITVERTAGLYRYGLIKVGTGALTAQPEMDYTPVLTELRFLPGQQSQKFRVPILNGENREDLQFVIKLDDESPNLSEDGNHAALVTIEAVKEAAIGIPYKAFQAVEEESKPGVGQVNLQSGLNSDFNIQSAVDYVDGRKVKKLNIKDVSSSNANYDHGKGWICLYTSGLLQHWWVKFNADLTMVDKIVWDWSNPSEGTHFTKWDWKTFSMVDAYWTDFYSYMKLPNGNGESRRYTIPQQWDATYVLNDDDRKQGSIEFGTYVKNNTGDSNLNLGTVNLYYKPINIVIKNSESSDEADEDSLVYPITWQSKSLYKASDKGIEIGKLQFKNQSSTIAQKAFYDGDTAEFSPIYKDSDIAKKVYLWGYKIYKTGGSGAGGYYYIKGNTLNIRDIYTGKMKDVDGNDIKKEYVLSYDDKKNEYITIRPVFKAKNAYVQINFDENKGGMINNSFKNGEVIKVGMFDTVNINAYANKGEHVFEFNPRDWNYEGKNITSDGDERILKDKNATEGKKVIEENKDKFQSISGLDEDVDSPGSLSFNPKKTYSTFNITHEPSMLTVMANPKSYEKDEKGKITDPLDADKGIVFYIPKGEEKDVDPDAQPGGDPGQDPITDPWEKLKDPDYDPWSTEEGKYAGDYLHELNINNTMINETYKISAFHDPDYIVKWRDFTGNTSKSGKLTPEEEEAIKKYKHLFDRDAVTGNTLNYTVKYPNSLIYYTFEKKPRQGVPGTMFGNVYLMGGDILKNSENAASTANMKPIPFAKLFINDLLVTADEKGYFDKSDETFFINAKNMITVSYKNTNYLGYFNTDVPSEVIIEEYDSFIPYDFTILEGVKKIDANQMNNKDADFKFSFKVTSKKPNLSATKALIRVYSQQGIIRKLLDEKEYLEVVPSEGLFSFTFNPAKNGIMPGDRMTVQLIDQTGAKHIEHNVGFTFLKYLKTFSLLTSFNSPVKADIEMVGVVDAVFDLGLSGKLDDFKDDHQKDLTIVFGFSKDWSDKIKKEIGDRSSGNTQPKDTPTKELKDAAKGGLSEKDKKDLVDNAVDKDGKNKKPAKLTSDMKFNLSASLYLYMAQNDRPGTENYGDYYFKEMIMSATLSGSFDTKVEIQTPIGVTVYMRLILGGDITAVMAIEQYEKKFYFDGNGNIDFSKAGGFSDFNRDFTIYSNFSINPYITLVVGATIPLAEISISGKAQFNMDFTTTGSGNGKVTVNAELALKILVFNFKWELANKTWDLFNYGNSRSFKANSIFAGTDYLYDSAEDYEVASREYLDNRGGWQGGSSGRMKLMAAGDNAYNEKTLQRGVYPYPYTLLAPIGDDQQLLVFLDDDTGKDDRNRTQLYYSIYEGGSWGRPVKVDNDGTPDDNPWISDMGDKVLVAWSSAVSKVQKDDTIIEVLNNRDIKARFFYKESKDFGDVQNVTYETENDTWSDTDPYIAYWKDKAGKENLMITYTKTQYEVTSDSGDEDAVVGDIIKPSETFLSYRFYDFKNNRWDESPDLGDGYYGQGFIDVSEYVEVDEEDILISEDPPIYDSDNPEFRFDGDWQWNGYWSRIPKLSEVSMGSFGSDPLIVDSNAVGYEDFAVLAYSIDVDRDIATTTDRKLFIQLYSFAEKRFYPPIYFDDTKGQTDLEFVQSDDNVYLYFVSDGDIVSINIGYLFSEGFLRYDIPGRDTHVLVLNKLKEVYRKPEVIVKHRYETRLNESGEVERYNECPIDQFMVKSDDNNVYVMWTENEISYRDGIDPNSPEGAEPDSRFSEKHIYAARQILSDIKEIQLYDENGEELTYPEYDEKGIRIDYNTVPDINYEVGKVKAGDPIIVKYREAEWSQPVKLTNEQGANFNDIDFEILSDGNLRAVFVKGMSQVMDVAGEDMPVENINDRVLMTADFDVSIKKAEVSMEPIKMPWQNEVIHPEIELKNKGLSPLKDITVELYQLIGDGEEKAYEMNNISLRGGEKKSISLNWQAPEQIMETKLRVQVKDNGVILCGAEQEIRAEGIIDIINAKAEAIERNKMKITGTAVNHGNIASDNAEIFANASGQVIGSTSIGKLDIGEDKYFEFFAVTKSDMYESMTDEDGSVAETLKVNVYSNGNVIKLKDERHADKAEIDLIKNIETFELNANNDKIGKSLSLIKGTRIDLVPDLAYADESMHNPRIVYVSNNEDVADFSQSYMTLSGKNTGTATITAYALPPINSAVLSQSGFERIDNFTTMAEAAVKVKTFEVNVHRDAPSDDDKEDRTNQNDSSPVVVSPPAANTTVTDNAVMVIATVQASIDKSGKGAASVTSAQIEGAIAQIVEAAKKNIGAAAKLEIKVEAPQGVKSIETSILASVMRKVSNSSIESMSVNTPIAEIALDSRTIAGIADKSDGGDIKITASRVEASSLPEEAQKLIGDRPVFDFSITSGGNLISKFTGNAAVSVPYTPKSDEDINAIVIYYINAKGVPEIVSNCAYNAETGNVTFKADHFSQFAVGYNKVTFKDVAPNSWYTDAVGFTAARGITTGTGDGNFSPDMKLTRAQLLVMAMRAYGIKPDDEWQDNFEDAGNTYYAGYLSAAKRLGITKGTGNNMYKPDNEITRQEMFTLLYNTLKSIDQLPEVKVGKGLADFSDSIKVAPWAKDATALFAKNGIISGGNGKLSPEDTGSRAQIAQIIYNLLSD